MLPYVSMMTMNRFSQGMFWLTASIVAGILFSFLGYAFPAQEQPPIVGALIWTGRLAFAIFLIPLFASPLHKLKRSALSTRLMRWRRNAGVAYGGVQVVHAVLIVVMFLTLDNPPTESIMVFVGAMGILLAAAMLLTSFDAPSRALGRQAWQQLHRAGFHIFMFIYFFDFIIEPIILNTPFSHAPYAALTLAGMALRTVVLLRRSPRAATA